MAIVSGGRGVSAGESPTYTGDKTITGNLTVQGSGVSEWTNTTGVIRLPRGTSAAPSLQFLGTDYGLYRTAAGTNGILFTVNTTDIAGVFQGTTPSLIQLESSSAFGWGAGAPNGTPDLLLVRVATRRLGVRGGVNNILDVYGTGTDTTNYERLALITAAGDYTITPQAAGTGTLRGMAIGAAATSLGFYGVAAVARPAAYTQTFATPTRTHSVDGSADLATTASTQTSPWGFGTAAQADNIATQFNLLRTAVGNIKELVNSVIDDLQANGLLQ